MDTFVDSSWYFIRYCDAHNDKAPFDKDKANYWLPVDQYIGGIEHACMHLIYSRFWHKFLRDEGLIKSDEPFTNLLTQGMVTLDGSAMSKSRGNVVSPDKIIEKYGADTARLFILFAAPPQKQLEWSMDGVEGCWRFINRIWRLQEIVDAEGNSPFVKRGTRMGSEGDFAVPVVIAGSDPQSHAKQKQRQIAGQARNDAAEANSPFIKRGTRMGSEGDFAVISEGEIAGQARNDAGGVYTDEAGKELLRLMHQTIKKVGIDIEKKMQFNTAISAIMELVNALYAYKFHLKDGGISRQVYKTVVLLMAPFTPHLSEEIWSNLGEKGFISKAKFPDFDESVIKEETTEIPVQINGKVRGKIIVSQNSDEKEVKSLIDADEKIQASLVGKQVIKFIYIKGKIVTMAVK
jgi:leucyl-tRNA synthetase